MSKTTKKLLAAVLALGLLVGAYFAVTGLLPEEDADSSSENSSNTSSETESTITETMYEFDIDTFVGAEITEFDGDVYHVARGEDGFVVTELEGLTYYTSYVDSCAERLSAFPYTVKVADSITDEQKKEYGLDDTAATAVITFDDHTETLRVGKKNDDGYYYLQHEGDPAVYGGTVGVNVYFGTGFLGFVNTGLFYCAEDYRTGIDNLSIVDANLPDPLHISKCKEGTASALALSSAYCMTFPCFMGTDDEALDAGLTELASFSAESVVAVVNEDTDLSLYGLDQPRYTIKYTYQKPTEDEINNNPVEAYEFLVSEVTEDGVQYVLNNEKTLVMSIPAGTYSFLSWNMENMAGPVFLSPLIKYLDRVTVTYGDKDYVFELTAGGNSITAVNYLDRQLDVENFKKFYQVILGTSWSGLGQAEENEADYFTVRFDYQDDLEKEDDVMSLKKYSLRQYAVEINGSGRFTVSKTRVDKLVSDLNKVINNETVSAFMS